MPRQNQIDPRVRGSRPFDAPGNYVNAINVRPNVNQVPSQLANILLGVTGITTEINNNRRLESIRQEQAKIKLDEESKVKYAQDSMLNISELEAKFQETGSSTDRSILINALRTAAEDDNLPSNYRIQINNTLGNLTENIRLSEEREELNRQALLFEDNKLLINDILFEQSVEIVDGSDLTNPKDFKEAKESLTQLVNDQLDKLGITEPELRTKYKNNLLDSTYQRLNVARKNQLDALVPQALRSEIQGALYTTDDFTETYTSLIPKYDAKTLISISRGYLENEYPVANDIEGFLSKVDLIASHARGSGNDSGIDSFINRQYEKVGSLLNNYIYAQMSEAGTPVDEILNEFNSLYGQSLGVVWDGDGFNNVTNNPNISTISSFLNKPDSVAGTLKDYASTDSGRARLPYQVANPADALSSLRRLSLADRLFSEGLNQNEIDTISDQLQALGFNDEAERFRQNRIMDINDPSVNKVLRAVGESEGSWLLRNTQSYGLLADRINDHINNNTHGSAEYIKGLVNSAGTRWRDILAEADRNGLDSPEEYSFVISAFAIANDPVFEDVTSQGTISTTALDRMIKAKQDYRELIGYMAPSASKDNPWSMKNAPKIIQKLSEKMGGRNKWLVFEDKPLLINMVLNRAPQDAEAFDAAVDHVWNLVNSSPLLTLENNRLEMDIEGYTNQAWEQHTNESFDKTFKKFLFKDLFYKDVAELDTEDFDFPSFIPGPLRALAGAADDLVGKKLRQFQTSQLSFNYKREDVATKIARANTLATLLGVDPVSDGKTISAEETMLAYLNEAKKIDSITAAREALKSDAIEWVLEDGQLSMILNFPVDDFNQYGFLTGPRRIDIRNLKTGEPVLLGVRQWGDIITGKALDPTVVPPLPRPRIVQDNTVE